ncbi:MAG: DUF2075 domain-containing protein [Rhizobium sp.]|nr:DUF2075 domain-containing protein [Rhizobium sp.]
MRAADGLEVDHIGVILGPDLVVRDGRFVTRPECRSKMDRSIRGWKKLVKEQPEAMARVDRIIRNTYRTLMTRGMKSCTVTSLDEETRAYIKGRIYAYNGPMS